MKKVLVLVLCVVLACGVLVGCNAADKMFEEAAAVLSTSDSMYYEIAEDGSYIMVDTNPANLEDYYDADIDVSVELVNRTLGFSDSVYEKMISTRAMDGRQTDENDHFKVSWTYHPDNGLEIMYEKK